VIKWKSLEAAEEEFVEICRSVDEEEVEVAAHNGENI
jgi:hypothetical protein